MGKRILITSGRSTNALGLARQFNEAGHQVITIDTMQWHMCRFSKAVEKNYCVVSPRKDERTFVSQILKIVEEEKIDLVIPIYEEIVYLCKNRTLFPKTCLIFAPSWETFCSLHNKWQFYLKLKSLSLSVPETHLIEKEEDLKKLNAFQSFAIKPIYSRASLNLKKKVPGKTLPPLSIKAPNFWIAQEWLDGKQFCSYSICHEGKMKAHVVYPVEYTADGKGCISFTSISHPPIFEWVENLVKILKFTGQIAFDFIEKGDEIFAIECNPRSTNGSLLFGREDHLPAAFLNETDTIAIPSNDQTKQIFIAMLLYGWRKSSFPGNKFKTYFKDTSLKKDVIYDRLDPRPFFTQPLTLSEIIFHSLLHQKSLPAAYLHDYEWNGEFNDERSSF